jgi:hypothetical protein
VTTGATGPAAGRYRAGTFFDIAVTWDQPVDVTDTPRIPITVGGVPQFAAYHAGTGTATLTFRYTVQPGDTGVLVVSSPIQLNSGTITNSGLNSGLTFTPPTTAGVIADTTQASVMDSRVRFGTAGTYTLTGAARTTNLPWQITRIQVNFDEAVNVTTGTLLGLPGGVSVASVAGNGTASIIFVLNMAIPAGSLVTLTLATTGADAVQDLAGNLGLAAAFSQSFSVGTYGDVSGDGRVTSADLARVNQVRLAGPSGYDPFCDLDGDGDVDADDVGIVRSQLGR